MNLFDTNFQQHFSEKELELLNKNKSIKANLEKNKIKKVNKQSIFRSNQAEIIIEKLDNNQIKIDGEGKLTQKDIIYFIHELLRISEQKYKSSYEPITKIIL